MTLMCDEQEKSFVRMFYILRRKDFAEHPACHFRFYRHVQYRIGNRQRIIRNIYAVCVPLRPFGGVVQAHAGTGYGNIFMEDSRFYGDIRF